MAAYFQRLKEWEKRKMAEEDETDPMPIMPAEDDGVTDFEEMKRRQDAYRKEYEDWEVCHGLREIENGELRLMEGSTPPPSEEGAMADMEAEVRALQEIGDNIGFDTTPEGAKKEVKYAVINRRKNLESASAEDAIFLHDLGKKIEGVAKGLATRSQHTGQQIGRDGKPVKVTTKMLREALPDLIEGTYGYEIVKGEDGLQFIDVRDQMPIQKTPEVQALMDEIKDWYDNFFHLIEDAGLRGDAGYIEKGYVNHIWDKEKSDPKAWAKYIENFQRTKSPNMKKREIPTYAEGIAVGLVPKYTDIIDIMAYYSRSNNEAIANRKFLDDLTCINVNEMNDSGEVIRTLAMLSSVEPDYFVKEFYSKPYEVPGVGNVWVHKAVQTRFASIFGTMRTGDVPDWVHQLGKGYDLISGTAKKIQLSFSGFHAGALTEVALAQMRPDRGMQALFKYVLYDSLKQGTLPAYAHPDDFKLAAKHLVQLGATADYAAADVLVMTEKLRDAVKKLAEQEADGRYDIATYTTKGIGKVGTPLATMLDWMNKGLDKALWNYIHDGLKIACFKMLAEQVDRRIDKIYGQTAGESSTQPNHAGTIANGEPLERREVMRDRLLDEAGQYVNDTFGGQYWELLGVTPAQLKWVRRFFLSPDWLVSTQRHFFANFGFGSLYNEGGFVEYLKYNRDNLKRAFGVKIPRNEYRRLRSKNAKQCYLLGVCVFFYSMMNGINALMRAKDEKEEKEKAEELRKENPDYRSPYELAYPGGMKWYDYTMLGNSLGQQTHLFLGRYKDGTEWYARWGKQFREFPELFMGRHGLEFPAPMIERMMGKSNPMISYLRDGLGTLDVHGFDIPYQEKEVVEKYGKTIGFLSMTAHHFLPFSVPTQSDKEFKWLDLVMPSQKGFSRWKTIDFFKTYITAGDMHGVEQTYHAAVMNNIDAEECLKAAIASVKAAQKKELEGGVTDLTTAFEAFNKATSLKEKKQMRKKIMQYLADSEYETISKAEAVDMALEFVNGQDAQAVSGDNDKYVMLANADDIRDDYKTDMLYRKAGERQHELKELEKGGKNTRQWKKAFGHWIEIRELLNDYRKEVRGMKKELGGNNDKKVMGDIRKARKEVLRKIEGMK